MADFAARPTSTRHELPPLAVVLYATAAALAGASLWAQYLGQPDYAFTTILFADQDFICALAIAVALALAARLTAALSQPVALKVQPAHLAMLATCIAALVSLAGVRLVFFNYGLTRDEAMAAFDAAILSGGQLVATVPAEWRAFTDALEPEFLFRLSGGLAWSSLYLPGNALLRALVGMAADPAWTGPLLIALAGWATWGSARILWPGRPDAALVATLLVFGAPQVIITGMTAYAMTAHLALNMLWLRLFLQNTKVSHAGAIATGWLATGLHQIVFHPLFAAPFILQMWIERRRTLAVSYAAFYGLIGLFWLSYARLATGLYGLSPADGVSDPLGNAMALVSNFSIFGLNTMLKNLLRFITWQHLALVPLVALALRHRRELPAVLVSLLAGLALTLAAALVLMPYQGHGWGYRYIHGLIGGMALVAAYGWISTTGGANPDRRASVNMMVYATLATVMVLLPLRAAQARAFVTPYARAHELIRASKDDVVIVDRTGLMFAVDLVRNDPLLRNVPKVLDLASLDEAQIQTLCRAYRVGIFDRKAGVALGIPVVESETAADARRRAKRDFLDRNGCGEIIPPP